jgi:hypothetical protein
VAISRFSRAGDSRLVADAAGASLRVRAQMREIDAEMAGIVLGRRRGPAAATRRD